jgi:hypothetical protein
MKHTVSFQEHPSAKMARNSATPPDPFVGWEVGLAYELLEVLGKGSYGIVAKANNR